MYQKKFAGNGMKGIVVIIISFIIFTTYSVLHITYHHQSRYNIETKYILQWTKPYTEPFVFMGKGRSVFIKNRCSVNNCYITADRNMLSNVSKFDAILFHGPELYREILPLPTHRSPHQKYVFVSMESAAYYPLYQKTYNDYFNWTWTYKLNSDIYYGYMIIKNKEGGIIGPNKNMHWLNVDAMQPVNHELREKLRFKKFAAAWFVSNCKALSKRGNIAKQLQTELAKHKMSLDIYGKCGTKTCPKNNTDECLYVLERHYFFYLSFENSFGEDYVTEKLLNALQHYTVPIVYGGANYTRFLPDGSYLNARNQTVKELVKQMMSLIYDKEKYYKYFRWNNHYTYHKVEETPETDYYCNFCQKINDKDSLQQSSYTNFVNWWNNKLN